MHRARARHVNVGLKARCKPLLHPAQLAPLSLALPCLGLRARVRLSLRTRPLGLQAGARFRSLPACVGDGSQWGTGPLRPSFHALQEGSILWPRV